MAVYELQVPHRLHLEKDNRVWYGFCQDWYRDAFQQKAGCGPTTAAYMLAYCFMRDGIRNISGKADAISFMEEIWNYVTPTYGGLFKTRWLADGVARFLADIHVTDYTVRMLTVSAVSAYRPTANEVERFIQSGLEADSPVAFLNRHRGLETELETWHWVPLIKMTTDTEPATAWCYDDGTVCRFTPAKWLVNTILGGGFVYIEKKRGSENENCQ